MVTVLLLAALFAPAGPKEIARALIRISPGDRHAWWTSYEPQLSPGTVAKGAQAAHSQTSTLHRGRDCFVGQGMPFLHENWADTLDLTLKNSSTAANLFGPLFIEISEAGPRPLLIKTDDKRDSNHEGPPLLHLQWSTTVRASQGYGGPEGTKAYPNNPATFSGDGCIPARKLIPPAGASAPVANRIWYDGVAKRVAQSNPALKIALPKKNTTEVARFDVLGPPVSLLIEPFFEEVLCYSQPLTTPFCPNSSCPATFAGFAQPYNGLGRYANATHLAEHSTAAAEAWQVMDVRPTLFPAINGTGVMHVNITRNYTYLVGTQADSAGRRPLLRYETTQSIPFRRDSHGKQHVLPANSGVRDCTVLDFTLGYTAGALAVPATRFAPPGGLTSCAPI